MPTSVIHPWMEGGGGHISFVRSISTKTWIDFQGNIGASESELQLLVTFCMSLMCQDFLISLTRSGSQRRSIVD